MNGIVLGPVIAAMFMVVWDILATSNDGSPHRSTKPADGRRN
jgi:hypothetical protein